jgi:four helix bundle protein
MRAESKRPASELKVRLKTYALEILDLLDELPNRRRFWNLSNQLSRSATSVGANYREAQRARSDSEFIAKIGDSLKELDESEWWLELIQASLENPSEKVTALLEETNQLLAILTTIVKKVRARLK